MTRIQDEQKQDKDYESEIKAQQSYHTERRPWMSQLTVL